MVGSGPAGLACAQQLARAGHEVHVFEKFAKAGGRLRYGIPDFKMEKGIIDRRVAQMEGEGVVFHYNTPVGGTYAGAVDPQDLLKIYDAIALTGGAEAPRDLPIPGRDLDGIHFAMDFLPQQNRRVGKRAARRYPRDSCQGQGRGGDRRRRHPAPIASATSIRQGATSVTQLEIMAAPPEHENKALTWPNWPLKMRTSSSQAEGAKREYAVLTQKFSGSDGKVAKLHGIQVDEKSSRSPAPSSNSRPNWCCWRWASSIRCMRAC